ncbi:hypothetical protein BAC1_00316 [uncultured bacterium]|nr:hypothetical protein BAC1_00316 [uncultured bacterium]
MPEKIQLTRKELYEQVWSEPMIKLSKRYGLSDVGLRKRCKKLNIPVPALGYWRKKEVGKAEPPPPLPPFDGDETIEFHVKVEKAERQPLDAEHYTEAEAKIAFESDENNRICVPSTLRSPHPYVAKTKEAFEGAEPSRYSRDKGLLNAHGEKLDISVSRNSLQRALRIMNSLIKALEARGFKVLIVAEKKNEYYTAYKTCGFVLGQTIEFGLKEFLKQTKRELTPTERKEKPWADKFEYEYNPSGRLSLEIKNWSAPRKNWSDAKIKKVEDCLNDFIVALIKTSIELRTREVQRKQEEHSRLEWERLRAEREQLRREEEARLQNLIDNASNWQKCKQIREYIQVIKEDAIRKNGGIEPGSKLEKWLTWANQQADRFDPLVESTSSICGKKE